MVSGSTVLSTPRLTLREMNAGDAPFILRLLSDETFLRYVGDKGVRTEADARDYIAAGPAASYEAFGFGLWLVMLKEGDVPIGICGLLKRPVLDHVDIGFALMPAWRTAGYAYEAASAVVDYARTTLRLTRLLAITSADNHISGRLLEKLGFAFERMAQIHEGEAPLKLFSVSWTSS
jgi:RimJ/RimL family protein N-acetyltransferase